MQFSSIVLFNLPEVLDVWTFPVVVLAACNLHNAIMKVRCVLTCSSTSIWSLPGAETVRRGDMRQLEWGSEGGMMTENSHRLWSSAAGHADYDPERVPLRKTHVGSK